MRRELTSCFYVTIPSKFSCKYTHVCRVFINICFWYAIVIHLWVMLWVACASPWNMFAVFKIHHPWVPCFRNSHVLSMSLFKESFQWCFRHVSHLPSCGLRTPWYVYVATAVPLGGHWPFVSQCVSFFPTFTQAIFAIHEDYTHSTAQFPPGPTCHIELDHLRQYSFNQLVGFIVIISQHLSATDRIHTPSVHPLTSLSRVFQHSYSVTPVASFAFGFFSGSLAGITLVLYFIFTA